MKQIKRMILSLLCIGCLVGIAISGWNIWNQWKPQAEAANLYEEIRHQVFPTIAIQERQDELEAVEEPNGEEAWYAPDWKKLQKLNSDICGWIYSSGTEISYPIVQGMDNSWYLDHSIDQRKSVAGSIFMEAGNQSDFSDDVSVIYGHHIRGGKMFSSLSGYKQQNYYEKHPELYLYTPEVTYRIELFAGTILNGATDDFPLTFGNEEARSLWLKAIFDASTFQSAVRPQRGEQILVLCTCSYEYKEARYAVYGVMRRIEIDTDEESEENAG